MLVLLKAEIGPQDLSICQSTVSLYKRVDLSFEIA
jgi:hypothetical protein